MDRGWLLLEGEAQLKLHTIKVEANNQEGDDNPSQSKGEDVAHVMSRHAPSRFSRGFDCGDILMIGHPGNPWPRQRTGRLDTSRSYSVLSALTFPLPPSSFLNDLGGLS
jgi:hypothetical protein